MVEVGLISRFYRRNWKIRVYLIQDLRQQQFFFQLAKGDRYRNWYNRDQLKWGKGLQWIVLSSGGVKIVTDGQELKAAFHVLACYGWVLRYTNKLEGVVKNI